MKMKFEYSGQEYIRVTSLNQHLQILMMNKKGKWSTLLLNLPSESEGGKPCLFHLMSFPSEYKG